MDSLLERKLENPKMNLEGEGVGGGAEHDAPLSRSRPPPKDLTLILSLRCR